MKLKKLLCGVTAAIMALSSVAIASFTTASAANDPIKSTKGWYRSGGDDASSIDILLRDNNGTQIGTQTVTVDKDGQYELKIDGITLSAQSAFFMKSTEEVKGTVANENAIITVDEVIVNGKAATIPDKMKGVSAYDWDAAKYFKFDLYNAWNPSKSITLPSGVSTIESLSIKFTLKDIIKTTTPDPSKPDPVPTPKPGNDKVTASVMFTALGYYPRIDPKEANPITADITGDGQYKLVVPAKHFDGTDSDVNGVIVLVIDFLNCKNDFSFDAKLDSVTVKGEEIVTDASKAIFGDIEDQNDNLRLEIYNQWGDTSKVGAPINPDKVLYKAGEEMVITFTVSNFKKIAKPTPSSPSVNNPSKVPTTVATAKKTRNPKQVAKDKKAAKKAMKQAKLNSLKVKSKAKKKINVTWKKVKKAKGYQVQVSAKKNFKKVIFKKDLKKTKLTIKNKKIKSKKTYYVRVRAYATYKNVNNKTVKVFSKWNKKLRKVKVK